MKLNFQGIEKIKYLAFQRREQRKKKTGKKASQKV